MNIKDQVKKEFHSFGYEDAKLGRKLSDADYFILSEAKRHVQIHFKQIHLLSDNITKLKFTKKSLIIDSNEIKRLKNKKNNQNNMDEIDDAIDILNNEIKEMEKDINSLNHLITNDISIEIENTFGILLYYYETGYLTFKYEEMNKQGLLPGENNISDLTKDIIEQYTRNSELGKNNLD